MVKHKNYQEKARIKTGVIRSCLDKTLNERNDRYDSKVKRIVRTGVLSGLATIILTLNGCEIPSNEDSSNGGPMYHSKTNGNVVINYENNVSISTNYLSIASNDDDDWEYEEDNDEDELLTDKSIEAPIETSVDEPIDDGRIQYDENPFGG